MNNLARSENPYEAPEIRSGHEPTEFYRIDLRRITYREYWRNSVNKSVALVHILNKALGQRGTVFFGSSRPVSAPELPWEALPFHVQEAASELRESLERAGFEFRFAENYQTLTGNNAECHSAFFLSDDARVLAHLYYLRFSFRAIEQAHLQIHLATRPDLRKVDSTSNYHSVFDGLDERFRQTIRRAPLAKLLEAHRSLVPEAWDQLVPWPSDDQILATLLLRRGQDLFDHLIDRGIFVPLNARELGRLQRRSDTYGLTPNAPEPGKTVFKKRYLLYYLLLGFVVFVSTILILSYFDQL